MTEQIQPLVTIIVLPGSTDDIEKSLASAHRQTYTPLEVLAPADFSYFSDSLPGTGSLVQLLEAGDLLHPEKINEQAALLLGENADACWGACAYVDQADREEPTAAVFTRFDADFLAAQTARHLVATCGALATRPAFDAGRGAKCAWEFWRNIAAAGRRFVYHDQAHAFFKSHPHGSHHDPATLLLHADFLERLSTNSDNRFSFALAYAWAVEVLGPWYLIEERLGVEVSPERRRVAAAHLFGLIDRLDDGDWLRREAPGLTQADRAVLLGQAHYAARREGDRRAAALAEAAGRALAEVAAHDHDPYTPSRLQNLYEVFLRTGDADVYGPYQEALRRLIYHQIAREKELDNDYRQAVRRLTQTAFDELAARGFRRVGLYGGGLHTSRLLLWISRGLVEVGELELLAVADDRPEKQGLMLSGVPIVSPQKMIDLLPDAVLLSSDCFENTLYEKSRPVRDAGIPVERIYGEENPQQHEPVR